MYAGDLEVQMLADLRDCKMLKADLVMTCYDYSKSIGYDKNLLSQKSAIPLFLRSLLCRCPGAHHETWE